MDKYDHAKELRMVAGKERLIHPKDITFFQNAARALVAGVKAQQLGLCPSSTPETDTAEEACSGRPTEEMNGTPAREPLADPNGNMQAQISAAIRGLDMAMEKMDRRDAILENILHPRD